MRSPSEMKFNGEVDRISRRDEAMYKRSTRTSKKLTMGMRRTRIFVYGTLLTGEPNHRVLASSELLGVAQTAPIYEFVHLGPFPAMARGGYTAVRGELYDVDDDTLDMLDQLEGHPDFYQRSSVVLEGGDVVQTYLMKPEQVQQRPRIKSGNWRHERGGKGISCASGL